MEDASPSGARFKARLSKAWTTIRLWVILVLGIVGSTAALSIPQNGVGDAFGLQVGDVAPQDILAPYALTYTSDVLTEQARQAAADAVPLVYDAPDASVARQQLERLQAALDYIEAVRADTFSDVAQKTSDLTAMADIPLDAETASALLKLNEAQWQTVKAEAQSVLEQVMRNEIRQDRLEEARRTIPALVSISLPESQAALVVTLTTPFIAPNAVPNVEATELLQEQAREAVEPISKSFVAGETIISRGELVTALDLEALEHYGLLKAPDPWQQIAVRALLVILLAGLFSLYGLRVHPDKLSNINLATMVAVLFVVTTLGMQVMIPERTVLPYIFPAATLPIFLAVFFGPGMGVVASIIVGALAGFLAPRGLELALYTVFGGALASLMVGKAERLASFTWAGIAASAGSALVVIIFRFPDPATDLLGKASLLGASIVSGLLSASLGFGLLLILGNLLGITTNLQLIELSRPDHPLLQLLLRNAPGTYQHSLQVANLTEQAARAIGANPLLARVGALYHDIGKATKPQFFIENQVAGQNVHEQLDATTSADIIISHVEQGMELARKYRLPPSIKAFISEHHGTMQTSYQYRQAVDAAGGDEKNVDRRSFIYPGPRPRSKETALLMLADGVEAKARAEAPSSEEEIDKLVRWVIDDRLAKGQLDRTDLTLKDLDTIRKSFVSTLKNIYHPRIRYPQPQDASDSPLSKRQEATPTRQT